MKLISSSPFSPTPSQQHTLSLEPGIISSQDQRVNTIEHFQVTIEGVEQYFQNANRHHSQLLPRWAQ